MTGKTKTHTTTSSNGTGHKTDDPISPIDSKGAKAILRASGGHHIASRTHAAVLKLEDWGNMLQCIEESAIDRRRDAIEQWFHFQRGRVCSDARAAEMRRALLLSAIAVEMEPDEPEIADGRQPFSFDLIDSTTFFNEAYDVEWDIEGLSVKAEPVVTGGPQKTLKTSLLVAKSIALGTATSFLGRFRVPKARRVALISGESGRRVIQSTARQVCRAQGIGDPSKANVLWGFKLPQLTLSEHIELLRKTIEDNGIEYIILDPFYLTIVAGKAGVDPKDMFQMGPLLSDMAQACLSAGATPDLAHHFVKRREDPHGLPEMSDLAGAGIGQFMRQWMLVAPRQPFDAEIGKFYLHLAYGGSAGHCGELAVDIEVGKLTPDGDERKWIVSIATPSQERQTKQQEREAARAAEAEAKRLAKAAEVEREERDDKAQVIAFLKKQPGRQATESMVRTAHRWRADKAKRILYLLVDAADVCTIEMTAKGGHGATQKVTGYRLNDGVEVPS